MNGPLLNTCFQHSVLTVYPNSLIFESDDNETKLQWTNSLIKMSNVYREKTIFVPFAPHFHPKTTPLSRPFTLPTHKYRPPKFLCRGYKAIPSSQKKFMAYAYRMTEGGIGNGVVPSTCLVAKNTFYEVFLLVELEVDVFLPFSWHIGSKGQSQKNEREKTNLIVPKAWLRSWNWDSPLIPLEQNLGILYVL